MYYVLQQKCERRGGLMVITKLRCDLSLSKFIQKRARLVYRELEHVGESKYVSQQTTQRPS